MIFLFTIHLFFLPSIEFVSIRPFFIFQPVSFRIHTHFSFLSGALGAGDDASMKETSSGFCLDFWCLSFPYGCHPVYSILLRSGETLRLDSRFLSTNEWTQTQILGSSFHLQEKPFATPHRLTYWLTRVHARTPIPMYTQYTAELLI